MFTTTEIEKNNQRLIKIVNSKNNTTATLNLSFGGSLQELYLSETKVIEDISKTYDYTYSSALLFPFVNRVNDGKYIFESKEFKLNINEPEQNNAIHGLIYNKEFVVKSQECSSNKIIISLIYNEVKTQKGFPFTYQIELKYKITSFSVDLEVNIKNTDEKQFPFTVGWHPYFYSSDLSKSTIKFKSNKTIEFNDKSITNAVINKKKDNKILLNHTGFDDCYSLDTNKVVFKTPEYSFELNSNESNSYLQIYTPDNLSMVAIEPQTGISDSFNNKEGLKILKPNNTYRINWQIHLINQNT